MPEIHVKFKENGERFGVKARGRLRGINRDAMLYKFDGQEWNHLESESPQDSTILPSTGKISDIQLEDWGREKAQWYL
jgi:hypothetical protein